MFISHVEIYSFFIHFIYLGHLPMVLLKKKKREKRKTSNL